MDNETTKKSVMDVEWIPIYQKRLGDVVTYAKGKMSMAEFAKKCGMNPITFSRILKGDIKKPLSQEEIKTIAENSELDTKDIFEDLMRANGMVKKNTDADAVKLLFIWQASPTKQSCRLAPLVMLAPWSMIVFSAMTPVPI